MRPADVTAPDAGERAASWSRPCPRPRTRDRSRTRRRARRRPPATTATPSAPRRRGWNATVVRDRGHVVDRHGALDVPHQQVRVEILLRRVRRSTGCPTARARRRPRPAPGRTGSARRWCGRRPRVRSTTPARASDLSRFDSRAGDIFGTPRRRSLKCLLPSEQFAHDEHRPSLVEQFHRLRHRTELAISGHVLTSVVTGYGPSSDRPSDTDPSDTDMEPVPVQICH